MYENHTRYHIALLTNFSPSAIKYYVLHHSNNLFPVLFLFRLHLVLLTWCTWYECVIGIRFSKQMFWMFRKNPNVTYFFLPSIINVRIDMISYLFWLCRTWKDNGLLNKKLPIIVSFNAPFIIFNIFCSKWNYYLLKYIDYSK